MSREMIEKDIVIKFIEQLTIDIRELQRTHTELEYTFRKLEHIINHKPRIRTNLKQHE